MKVREIMTTDVVTASPGERFKDLVERMLARTVSCLPVVDDGQLVGIVTSYDFLEASARLFKKLLEGEPLPEKDLALAQTA